MVVFLARIVKFYFGYEYVKDIDLLHDHNRKIMHKEIEIRIGIIPGLLLACWWAGWLV
jgi:hypothetical protein